MKKLYVIGAVLLILALVIYFGLASFLGSAVKTGVNNYGPKFTKTNVTLSGAIISPFNGSGTLTGLTVGNPPGWTSERAFYLGKVGITIEPKSIFGDHIIIDEMIIDQPEFTYETKIVSSNIQDLLKNIQSFSGSGDQAAQTKSGQPIKFEVRKFRLTNGKANVIFNGQTILVPFPDLSLDDLGVKEGGITPDQAAAIIMKNVLSNIGTAAAKSLLQNRSSATIDQAKELGKKASDSIKKLFGKP